MCVYPLELPRNAHFPTSSKLEARPCPFYARGRCIFSERCNFVHDARNLPTYGASYTDRKRPSIQSVPRAPTLTSSISTKASTHASLSSYHSSKSSSRVVDPRYPIVQITAETPELSFEIEVDESPPSSLSTESTSSSEEAEADREKDQDIKHTPSDLGPNVQEVDVIPNNGFAPLPFTLVRTSPTTLIHILDFDLHGP